MQRCMGCMKEFGKEYDVCPHCGYIVGTKPKINSHLPCGTVIGGRYILGKVLGYGGFGVTYLAWDEKLERPVAVKEFFPHAISTRSEGSAEVSCYDEKASEFFQKGVKKMLNEGHALSKFSSNKNIVNIYDCFEENNTAYIIMEYLEGIDARSLLSEQDDGRLEAKQAVRIILPVLDALEEMHGEKLIHRDVSPDNIFLCNDRKIKLLDFGSARIAVQDREKSLSVIVKPGYAPREQYASRSKQGPWTDIYAVCATLYKLITGETPPDSMERDEIEIKPFSEFGITGYERLEKVILRGMAMDIPDRIRSVATLRSQLRKALQPPEAEEKPAEKQPEATEENQQPIPAEKPETVYESVEVKPETETVPPAGSAKKKISVIAAAVVAVVVAAVLFIAKPWDTAPAVSGDEIRTQENAAAVTEQTDPAQQAEEITVSDPDASMKVKYEEHLNSQKKTYFESSSGTWDGKKTIEYIDIDGDSTEECFLTATFKKGKSAEASYVHLLDVKDDKVSCVYSSGEISDKTSFLLKKDSKGNYSLVECELADEAKASVYSYDGNKIKLIHGMKKDLKEKDDSAVAGYSHYSTKIDGLKGSFKDSDKITGTELNKKWNSLVCGKSVFSCGKEPEKLVDSTLDKMLDNLKKAGGDPLNIRKIVFGDLDKNGEKEALMLVGGEQHEVLEDEFSGAKVWYADARYAEAVSDMLAKEHDWLSDTNWTDLGYSSCSTTGFFTLSPWSNYNYTFVYTLKDGKIIDCTPYNHYSSAYEGYDFAGEKNEDGEPPQNFNINEAGELCLGYYTGDTYGHCWSEYSLKWDAANYTFVENGALEISTTEFSRLDEASSLLFDIRMARYDIHNILYRINDGREEIIINCYMPSGSGEMSASCHLVLYFEGETVVLADPQQSFTGETPGGSPDFYVNLNGGHVRKRVTENVVYPEDFPY